MLNARNGKGQFAQGNAGGPGNPYAVKALHFKQVFQDATTDEQVRAVQKALFDEALKGNTKAAQLWLETLKGKPEQAIVDQTVHAKIEHTMEEFEQAMKDAGWVKLPDGMTKAPQIENAN